MLNDDVLDFIKKNNMDLKKLLQNDSSQLSTTNDINRIIGNYGYFSEEEDAFVSVADIVGYNCIQDQQNKNIFLNFDNFFDSQGDGYHSRSIGMLNYSSEEIIEGLRYSFKEEPIVVEAITEGKHLISTNGLHRYTVLRSHFVNESYGLDEDSIEYKKVREKYTIPVKLKKVDLIKTYANFLLSTHPDFEIFMSSEFDNNYRYTGRVILELPNNKRLTLDDDELIRFLKQILTNTKCSDYFERINNYSAKYDS
ncbi:MAG: hypothetical protein PHG18_03465, partial [Bacilli bacterium]|nr:hypothetical protein [Bacilli bacterium]